MRPLNTHRLCAIPIRQAADGSFELSAALASALGATPLASLQASLGSPGVSAAVAGLDGSVAARAWATALVVAALETAFASMRDSWALFGKRSTQWLRRALGGAAGAARVASLQAAAAAALSSA